MSISLALHLLFKVHVSNEKKELGKSFYLKINFKNYRKQACDNGANMVGKSKHEVGPRIQKYYDMYSSQFEFVSRRHPLRCASCGTREGPIQDLIDVPKAGTACLNS